MFTPEDVREAAALVKDDCGSWMLGELGPEGIADAVWDLYEPLQDMNDEEQEIFVRAVYVQIFQMNP